MTPSAIGRRTSLAYPNGTSTSYSYDAASRPTSMQHQGPSALIESLSYDYDAAGNRINLTRANGAATLLPANVQAAYDAANEMTNFNSATANLTYDANGNLTSQTDANGTTTYTWDARNRLIGINGPNVSASFVYDAFGRRVSKTINSVKTDYQYDGDDIVAEYDSGAMSATYLRSLNIDEPFVRQSAVEEYYHTDGLGSTLALTDSAGAVQTTYSYEPFGNTTVTGASGNPFKYTGREEDEGTGLYYYRARYYSPSLQRFLGEDLLGFEGGDVNLYGYVGNNPVNWVDPWGLEKQRDPELGEYGPLTNAIGHFIKNYTDMREANTIGADKYFHCKANCQSAKEGPVGKGVSVIISEGREYTDEYIKGDSRQASDADRSANKQGRDDGNVGTPCSQTCDSLRPNGLGPRY